MAKRVAKVQKAPEVVLTPLELKERMLRHAESMVEYRLREYREKLDEIRLRAERIGEEVTRDGTRELDRQMAILEDPAKSEEERVLPDLSSISVQIVNNVMWGIANMSLGNITRCAIDLRQALIIRNQRRAELAAVKADVESALEFKAQLGEEI